MLILYLLGLANVFGTLVRNEEGALKQENLSKVFLQNGSQAYSKSDEGLEEETAVAKILAQIEDAMDEETVDGEPEEEFNDLDGEQDDESEDFDGEQDDEFDGEQDDEFDGE